jgi:isopentenyl diphosphate isomerase/L-lactate dehydrogenase-like FMN-dependent dehydrogenase
VQAAGRPVLVDGGLATFGQRGVARVMELLHAEMAVDLGMAGVSKIAEIDRSFVRIRK